MMPLRRRSYFDAERREYVFEQERSDGRWCETSRTPSPFLPPLIPTEVYGRSGAEIVAEQIGYAPCAGCGNRVFHLPDCARGKGLV